jgi:uncharacterized metal-binding protein
MFCLAGIGGRVSGIMKSTEAAGRILAVDGCVADCARRCLEVAGFTRCAHLRLSDLGMKKGETTIDEDSISRVVSAAVERLRASGCEKG